MRVHGQPAHRRAVERAMQSEGTTRPLFWAFLILLVWLPIPLGSNRSWAWSIMEVIAYALAAAWLILWSMGRASASEPLKRAWPALAVLGLVILLHILQLV